MRRHIVIALLLAAVLFGVYSSALPGPFLWDDKVLIPALKGGEGGAERIFQEMYPGTRTNYVRPLVLASFCLQAAVSGPSPRPFHVFNLVLQIGAGLGAAALAYLLTQNIAIGWMTGFFFALHPVHAEAVAYISGRADTLMALFVLWASVLYLGALRREERRVRSAGLALSLFCFGAALLSKEASLVLPVVFMAMDRVLPVSTRRLRPWLAFAALGLSFVVLRLTWWNAAGDILSKKGLGWGVVGLGARAAAFLKASVLGAGELVVPVGLHMEKRLAAEAITAASVAGAVIFIVIFIAARRRAPDRARLLNGSLLWAFIWFLPQSPFVFPDHFADHFLVLPSWSWAFVLAVFLSTLKRRVLSSVLAVGYALGLAVVSARVASGWSDETRFFERVVAQAPHSDRAREELGRVYLDRRRPEAAGLFAGLLGAGRTPETPGDMEAWIERLLRASDPGERTRTAVLLYHAGLSWQGTGRPDLAEQAYRAVLKLDPALGPAHNNLGSLLLSSGRLQEAFEHFVAATTLDPRDPVAFNNLGVVCAQLGMEEAARRHWKQALLLDPSYASAQRNLEASKELEKVLT